MKSENKGLKRTILYLVILNLIVGGSLIAVAEGTQEASRNPVERELDALVQVLEGEEDSFYSAYWNAKNWYDQWMQQNGLDGIYGYGWLNGDLSMEMEREAADIALAYWEEACGITPYNDFSLASEIHPIQHTLGDQARNLILVNRVHDDRMMNFYVLMDGKTFEILASTSVEEYKNSHAKAEILVEAERALYDKACRKAAEAVMQKYGCQHDWLTDEYFHTAEIMAHTPPQIQETDQMTWEVLIFPENGYAAEFTVWLDEQAEHVYSVKWHPDAYGRYTNEELENAIAALTTLEDAYLALVQEYGADYKVPLEHKAAFYQRCRAVLDAENLWDFLGFSPILQSGGMLAYSPQLFGGSMLDFEMLMPEAEDITEEKAREIITDGLMQYYGLTKAQAQSLTYYPVFYQQSVPAGRFWDFRMDMGNVTLFAATVDAGTGNLIAISEVHDQEESRNEKLISSLEARYGEWGVWPIEIKADYAHLYLGGDHDYGKPVEGQLSVENALSLAKETLLSTYPELTKEQLDNARICPYFCVKPHLLYDVVYDPPIYYFTFDIDGTYNCYEIILDGETEEIYLTHDPSNSGNG